MLGWKVHGVLEAARFHRNSLAGFSGVKIKDSVAEWIQHFWDNITYHTTESVDFSGHMNAATKRMTGDSESKDAECRVVFRIRGVRFWGCRVHSVWGCPGLGTRNPAWRVQGCSLAGSAV